MTDAGRIAANLAAVRVRIDAAAARAGRSRGAVALIAVSKNHPAGAVRAAYAAGQRDFGENRVQELGAKAAQLAELADLRWHMIGSLQTNKMRELLAVPRLVLLHSLDRPRLADALQSELAARGSTLSVLLQLHVTDEATKHGCAPGDAAALLLHVRDRCPNVRVDGIMAMGPAAGDAASSFSRACDLGAALRRASGLPLSIASLGMSGDFEAAIGCGATMVRIGTEVFGARA